MLGEFLFYSIRGFTSGFYIGKTNFDFFFKVSDRPRKICPGLAYRDLRTEAFNTFHRFGGQLRRPPKSNPVFSSSIDDLTNQYLPRRLQLSDVR
ncbi:hypothetical protein ASG84_26135 [Rhodococcus sp. Leaf278]|nr:hypothetical protein ASG84_26135 [Rhodococcus sp. Leaf278]